MDFTTDYGTFISKYSDAENEAELLLCLGSRFEIISIYPAIFERDHEIKQFTNLDDGTELTEEERGKLK